MNRIFGMLLAALLVTASRASAEDLTLRDVIELHRSGLGEDLLIAVIDADGGPFVLGFAEIQDLKSDGLSERVITALVRTGSRTGLPAVGAPVVHVQQEVINYVVPAVVVIETPGYQPFDAHPGASERHGRRPRPHGGGAVAAPAPPAAWVTQRQSGNNVNASGDPRRDVPAAAWVTPIDRKPEDKPQPRR